MGTTEEESAPSEEDNYTQDLSIVGRIQIQAIHCGISYLNFSYKYDAVSSFKGELAYFNISNIEGYINRQGEVVWKTTRNY